jgi:hypothetical protein
MKRQQRLDRMRAIEREFRIARLAVTTLRQALQADPTLLHGEELKVADANAFADNLEGTYLLRIFAEFEQGLRDWWLKGLRRRSSPKTFVLMEGIAARRHIPRLDLENAHLVRDHRNTLIHEESEYGRPVTFAEARRYLCTYFKWLPLTW